MMRSLLTCAILLASCQVAPKPDVGATPSAPAAATGDAVPAELRATFDRLLAAMLAEDLAGITREALPHAVTVTTTPRGEYGTDLSLPFVKSASFDRTLRVSHRNGACCMLLRTGSSYFHFVEIPEGGARTWKLYRYGDKPIE